MVCFGFEVGGYTAIGEGGRDVSPAFCRILDSILSWLEFCFDGLARRQTRAVAQSGSFLGELPFFSRNETDGNRCVPCGPRAVRLATVSRTMP